MVRKFSIYIYSAVKKLVLYFTTWLIIVTPQDTQRSLKKGKVQSGYVSRPCRVTPDALASKDHIPRGAV